MFFFKAILPYYIFMGYILFGDYIRYYPISCNHVHFILYFVNFYQLTLLICYK